jgi:hypothetical protein
MHLTRNSTSVRAPGLIQSRYEEEMIKAGHRQAHVTIDGSLTPHALFHTETRGCVRGMCVCVCDRVTDNVTRL